MTRWFEDVETDVPYPLGRHHFTHDEIAEFRAAYDPFSAGAVASGWHVAAIGHRLMVDTLAAESARLTAAGETPGVSGPSPGFNRLSLPHPVRAGDTVAYTLVVTHKRESKSLPGWGLLINHIIGCTESGETVYDVEVAAFIKRRDFTPTLKQRMTMTLTRLPLLGKWLAFRR
jgi:acyl dehydratase